MPNLAKMRTLPFIGLLIVHLSWSQLPLTLITERSLVVMEWPLESSGEFQLRGDWQKVTKQVQQNLGLMGVDAIGFVHGDDWTASAESQAIFRQFFETRQVKQLIRIGQANGLYVLSIEPWGGNTSPWRIEGGSLNQVLFRLGKAIKESGQVAENFLPADEPEIYVDVPFSKWTASVNYPDAIKRLKIGVAKRASDADNRKLEQLMQRYPFAFELIDYTDDEDAFRRGYQFVLVSMSTTGESIKRLLNYKTVSGVTHYMSTVAADSTQTKIKAIPADAFVHKFYFRNTVNHEAFVGTDWDADVSWQQSLTNFIQNLRIAFRVK